MCGGGGLDAIDAIARLRRQSEAIVGDRTQPLAASLTSSFRRATAPLLSLSLFLTAGLRLWLFTVEAELLRVVASLIRFDLD